MTSKQALERIKQHCMVGNPNSPYKQYNQSQIFIDKDIAVIEQELNKTAQLEEKLGIDLITLFKILEFQEIVVKNKGCISGYASNCSCGWFELNYNNKCMIYNVVRKEKYQQPKYYYFEDYGKTWALTKGELENDK